MPKQTAEKQQQKSSGLVASLNKLSDADEFKGPYQWYHFPLSYTIDSFKGVCPIVILLIMYRYRDAPYNALQNPFAWAYFGCHGSYGILWASKNLLGFGDTRFHKRAPLMMNFLTGLALMNYWLPAYLIASSTTRPPLYVLGMGVFLYCNGVFWHFCSDIHKSVFLEFRQKLQAEKLKTPNVLQTRLWAISRNPNYFGELLIYASFCTLSFHWLPCLTFGSMVAAVWIPSMIKKDQSLSRFGAEFEEYKKKSYFWIPGVY